MNIDIFIITETFLRPSIPNTFLHIDNYQIFRRDRELCHCRKTNCNRKHKGGGILIYVRSSLYAEVIDASKEVESMWIKVGVPSSSQLVFVNASYHPPKDHGNQLLSYLSITASELRRSHPSSITFVAGDFNRLDVSEIEMEGLITLKSTPTRLGATLDLVLTNRPDLISKVTGYSPSIQSDHQAVLVHPNQRLPAVRKRVTFSNFSFNNRKTFNKLIENHDFSFVHQTSDADTAAELLDQEIFNLVQAAFPTLTVWMSDRDPIWMTPHMKWLLRKRQRAARNNQGIKATKLFHMIEREKIGKLERIGAKQWWKQVNRVTHRKNNNLNLNPETFSAKELNTELVKRCEKCKDNSEIVNFDLGLKNEEPPELTLKEVAEILRFCKRSSSGPINIPYFIFKEYWDILAPHYHHVWNMSLRSAKFPSHYKQANVLPIPKTENPRTFNDIRGVSVTPITARMFEKAVHRRWISPAILERGDKFQFAYKRSSSTIDCLLTMQHEILSLLDKSNVDGVHVVFIDLSKAFDKVNQEKALNSYSKFIDSVFVRKWLYDFSVGRWQRLKWNNNVEEFLPVDGGCAQGTVGGPNMFTMYTDSIQAESSNARIFKYSDDMSIMVPCFRHSNLEDQQTLRNELSRFQESVENKELTINVTKSQHVRFCLNKIPICDCKDMVNDFKKVKCVKILGIYFQEDMKFSNHVTKLVNSLKRSLYVIRDLRLAQTTTENIDRVFEAIIISKIRYGISVYGSDMNSLKRIDHFLERCNRKGWTSKNYSTQAILEEEDARALQRILKCPTHPLHTYFMHSKKPTHNTRHNFSIIKPKTRTMIFANSFCNRVLPI